MIPLLQQINFVLISNRLQSARHRHRHPPSLSLSPLQHRYVLARCIRLPLFHIILRIILQLHVISLMNTVVQVPVALTEEQLREKVLQEAKQVQDAVSQHACVMLSLCFCFITYWLIIFWFVNQCCFRLRSKCGSARRSGLHWHSIAYILTTGFRQGACMAGGAQGTADCRGHSEAREWGMLVITLLF